MVFTPSLDNSLERPLYRQLAEYFLGLIRSGELGPGERLPATRELAGLLGINRTTVSAAYEALEAEGLISGQVGRGSFVAARPAPRTLDWDQLLAPSPLAASPDRKLAPGNPTISFATSRPPEDLFPLDAFRQSCEEVLADPRLGSILQLGSAGGYEPLRQYLLEQARDEGVLGREDDLLITNGCQQALDLLGRVLVRPGMRIALEDPVYPGLKNVLLAGGADLTTLRVDAGGLDRSGLRDGRAALVVLTPNYQNPTGLSLSLEDREAAVEGAGREGSVLIENDIYSDLRYEGDRLPSLKQLAPESGTVLLRSFSKVAFPGLRLGWVIGPRALIAAMRERKQMTDLHSDQFSQAVMLRFAQSGRLGEHIRLMIDAGRERLRAALLALAEFFPEGSQWTRPQGGFNLWVTLRDVDTGFLLDRAQRGGVAYQPGNVFAVRRNLNHSLRLSFGALRPEQIRAGIGILGRIFEAERETRQWSEREPATALV